MSHHRVLAVAASVAITGANLNLDVSGNVEQVVDARLVLQYHRVACDAAGLGTPNVIVD
jgi:hypothetical protein